jgi:hypothetical protein
MANLLWHTVDLDDEHQLCCGVGPGTVGLVVSCFMGAAQALTCH